MAGPRPDDPYNPVPTVQPQTGSPGNYLNVRATPEAFGSQVGRAVSGLGETLSQVGNQGMSLAIQNQGLANEHAATMAELQLATDGGEVYNKYRSLTGLDAHNSRGQAVQDYLAVNNKIRESLPNEAARKAYDQVAARRMAFTIQDINSYAAGQKVKAYQDGNKDQIELAIDQANSYGVASDPKQFSFNTGTIKHYLASTFTAPEYGLYQTVPSKLREDGSLEFDTTTDQGKIAQANYDQALNDATGKAWYNRIITLGNDPVHGNWTTAVDVFEANKDKIPAATRARLSAQLSGPYRAEQTRSMVDGILSEAHRDYLSSPSNIDTVQGQSIQQTLKALVPGAVFTSGQRTPEHNAEVGGVPNSMHLTGNALDFVLPKGYDFEKFKGELALVGIKPTELLNEGDHVHLAWGSKGGQKQWNTLPDYLSDNASDLIERARQTAKDKGFDVSVQDAAAERMKSRISEAQYVQNQQVRVLGNKLYGIVTNSQNPVMNEDALDNSQDPQVRNDWFQLQSLDPNRAQAIMNRIKANATSDNASYGTDFYTNYAKALSGTLEPDWGSAVGGSKSPISGSGSDQIARVLEDTQTPEGRSFATEELKFLNGVRNNMTSPLPGMKLPELDGLFNKSLETVIPMIQAGRAKGLSPSQLFDPKSPDYVGKNIQYPTKAQITAAQFQHTTAQIRNPQAAAQDFKSLSDLQKSVGKTISREDAIKTAISKGWIRENPPAVPNSFGP